MKTVFFFFTGNEMNIKSSCSSVADVYVYVFVYVKAIVVFFEFATPLDRKLMVFAVRDSARFRCSGTFRF